MNRFDICEAYHLFASLYHGGQNCPVYRYLSRLSAIGFSPRHGLNGVTDLEPEARETFYNLCRKHNVKLGYRLDKLNFGWSLTNERTGEDSFFQFDSDLVSLARNLGWGGDVEAWICKGLTTDEDGYDHGDPIEWLYDHDHETFHRDLSDYFASDADMAQAAE